MVDRELYLNTKISKGIIPVLYDSVKGEVIDYSVMDVNTGHVILHFPDDLGDVKYKYRVFDAVRPGVSLFNGIYEAGGGYTHPTTHSADIIIDGDKNKVYTLQDHAKLAGIEDGANNYRHPSSHSADIIVDGDTNKAYTGLEKTKLEGIDAGANNYVLSKSGIESVLTGVIDSHSHSGGGGLTQAQILTRML